MAVQTILSLAGASIIWVSSVEAWAPSAAVQSVAARAQVSRTSAPLAAGQARPRVHGHKRPFCMVATVYAGGGASENDNRYEYEYVSPEPPTRAYGLQEFHYDPEKNCDDDDEDCWVDFDNDRAKWEERLRQQFLLLEGAAEVDQSLVEAPRPKVRVSEGMGKGKETPTQRLRMRQQALQYRWNMAGLRDEEEAVMCQQCEGVGQTECRFCDGTGYAKVNGKLVRGDGVAVSWCAVCQKKGEERCTECHGAGYIAAWMMPQQ